MTDDQALASAAEGAEPEDGHAAVPAQTPVAVAAGTGFAAPTGDDGWEDMWVNELAEPSGPEDPGSFRQRRARARQPGETTSTFDRVPPQDILAEQSVLGGMLLSKSAIADVMEILKPRDYYRPAHELIHSAVLDLYGRGEPADPITVASELTKRGELVRVGGPSYLYTLVNCVPTAANAAYYAEIVREQSVLRRLVEAGSRITGMGYAAEGDVEQMDAAQAEILAVAEQRGEENIAFLNVGLDATMGRVEDRQNGNGKITGIPTGFRDLDACTMGLQPGQLIIVAARPAMGKTTIASDILRSACIANNYTAVMFSLEMGREELQLRIVSAEGRSHCIICAPATWMTTTGTGPRWQ